MTLTTMASASETRRRILVAIDFGTDSLNFLQDEAEIPRYNLFWSCMGADGESESSLSSQILSLS